jgi:MYXO-CTERM domain-containing protein
MTTRLYGVSSVVLFGVVAASGCTQPTDDSPLGTAHQAVVNGCLLSTVGAACDPDGDGPLGACDGNCTLVGKEASCIPTSIGVNEGLPCGDLQNEHVNCNTSCRNGACTAGNADDGTACMPSGSPEHAAICEGACNAGSCEKLFHPKACVGSTSDAGTGEGGTSGDDAGSVSDDTGATSGDDSGASGGDDTGASGGDDSGAASGDDTGASSGDDSGSSADDTGASGADDTGASSSDDTGSSSGGDTGSSSGGAKDTGASGASTPANDDAGIVNADSGTGDNGGCGCRTAAAPTSGFGALLAGVALALVRLRRRRA